MPVTNCELDLETVYDKAYTLMDLNICKKLKTDEIYFYDKKHVGELEERYEALSLEEEHRRIVNDYDACKNSMMSRAMELAYLAGVEAVLAILLVKEQVA